MIFQYVEMKIHNLPTEILEIIFCKLDGCSLVKAQQVCRVWYDIIYHLQNCKNIWKNICLKEISIEIIEEFIGNKSIPLLAQNEQCKINWKNVYKMWFSGSKVKHWTYWKKQFLVFEANPINCVKNSGDLIITGHRNGSICTWNCYTGELLDVVGQHLGIVTDMAMINVLNEDFYENEKYKCYHHHVISISTDHQIQLSPLLGENYKINNKIMISYHSDSLENIKIFDNIIIISSMDNTLSVWEIIPCEENIEIKFKQAIHGPVHILRWIGFWKDEIFCLCQNGIFEVFSLHTNEWMSPEIKSLHSYSFCINDINRCINNSVLFRKGTVFIFCTDRQMIIPIGNSNYYFHAMLKLHTHITCIELFGNILALGSEKGSLYLYNINHPKELKDLELSNPSWCINLSEVSIIAISISFDNFLPRVTAATTEKIFFIHWLNQKSLTVSLTENMNIFNI